MFSALAAAAAALLFWVKYPSRGSQTKRGQDKLSEEGELIVTGPVIFYCDACGKDTLTEGLL